MGSVAVATADRRWCARSRADQAAHTRQHMSHQLRRWCPRPLCPQLGHGTWCDDIVRDQDRMPRRALWQGLRHQQQPRWRPHANARAGRFGCIDGSSPTFYGVGRGSEALDRSLTSSTTRGHPPLWYRAGETLQQNGGKPVKVSESCWTRKLLPTNNISQRPPLPFARCTGTCYGTRTVYNLDRPERICPLYNYTTRSSQKPGRG